MIKIFKGARIGRLRVIFHLPQTIYGAWPAPSCWTKEPLAYIEWYSRLKETAEDDHEMYMVSKPSFSNTNAPPPGDIIPLSAIRQTCQLIPDFRNEIPKEWTNSNVLDLCKRFYLNSFSSKYAYQTIW